VHAVVGDVGEEAHRRELVARAEILGGLDLVVHNAGVLGPSPQPSVGDYPLGELRRVFDLNVFAPIRLTQLLDQVLRPGATVVAITSDAAVEPYEGWGGYGSAKAALEQAFAVLGAERPDLHVHRIDPGDMRTQMHQEAFPGEDISDRPPASASVPGILAIVEQRLPSGRYVAKAHAPETADASPDVVPA
jgi:NAD(P)-dependent dehydrogenase (short-subunit alcohol dehydrogenase family)